MYAYRDWGDCRKQDAAYAVESLFQPLYLSGGSTCHPVVQQVAHVRTALWSPEDTPQNSYEHRQNCFMSIETHFSAEPKSGGKQQATCASITQLRWRKHTRLHCYGLDSFPRTASQAWDEGAGMAAVEGGQGFQIHPQPGQRCLPNAQARGERWSCPLSLAPQDHPHDVCMFSFL